MIFLILRSKMFSLTCKNNSLNSKNDSIIKKLCLDLTDNAMAFIFA
jgi:hypothetical protein